MNGCEACGCKEFINEKEGLACKKCGMIHTAEEVNSIPGAIIVDENALSFNERHLLEARAAYKIGDTTKAMSHYGAVKRSDPSCVEAVFYFYFMPAKSSLERMDMYSRKSAFEDLAKAVKQIGENFKIEEETIYRDTFVNIVYDIVQLYQTPFLLDISVVGDADKRETHGLFTKVAECMVNALSSIIGRFPEYQLKNTFALQQVRVGLCNALGCFAEGSAYPRSYWLKKASEYAHEVKSIDSSFDASVFEERYERVKKQENNSTTASCLGVLIFAAFVVAMIVIAFM